MYRVGIIGMGVGENHLKAFASHKMCEIKKICDFDQEKKSYLKKKYKQYEYVTEAFDVINDDAIDIVSIASYDNFHCDQIIRSIKNKKHIFIEKPMCLDEDELGRIIQNLKHHQDVKISSNLVLRTNSRFKYFRKQIKSGGVGDLFYIEADYYWGRIKKLYGWRAEMDYYSIILGAAIHMIDLVTWLIDKKPSYVYTVGNRLGTNDSHMKYNSFALL